MNIVHSPEPVLRQKAQKVKDPLSKEIQDLIPKMVDAMHKANGLGLAAPQVGVSLQLTIIEINGEIETYINPKITSKSKKLVVFEEGCLSIPGKFMPVIRHEKVQVRYTDKNGEQKKVKATGLLAVALQHEICHLEGILIEDLYKSQDAQLRKTLPELSL